MAVADTFSTPRVTWKLTPRAAIPKRVRMLRRLPSVLPSALALSAVLLAGCGTIYDDMYSPRRSRYTKPVEKREKSTVSDSGPIPAGDTTPLQPDSSTGPTAPPAMPPVDPAAAPIPGMDPAAPPADPGMAPPADPAMTPGVPGL